MTATRRAFLAALLSDVITGVQEARGTEHFKLSALDELPNDRLLRLIPELVDTAIRVDVAGNVFVRRGPAGAHTRIGTLDPVERSAVERFRGTERLADIVDDVARRHAAPRDDVFRRVRRVLLLLTTHGACRPVNPQSEA